MQSEGKVGRPADCDFMLGGYCTSGAAECAEDLFDASLYDFIDVPPTPPTAEAAVAESCISL